MITLNYKGKNYVNFTKEDLLASNVPLALIHANEFSSCKTDKLNELNSACQLELNALTSTYPQGEVSTFNKQETEARAYLSDNTASTPLLDALATNRNIDKNELANRVIAKSDVFSGASGAVIGKRQKLEDTLNGLSEQNNTIEDIAAITW